MFSVVYRFRVKPGREQLFQSSWRTLTQAIAEQRGSLGSRLHRNEADGTFVAYAVWPSEDVFNREVELQGPAVAARAEMRNNCESIETLFKMNVVDDLLKTDV